MQASSSDPVQRRLTDLRTALLTLHKVLLDSERDFYEHEVEKIKSPGHLLNLVIHDPWFAWLHELSELVVKIDLVQESKEVQPTHVDADRLVAQARSLLVPAEEGSGFPKRYYEAMQRDPDVIIAHGRTAKLMASLANPA